MNTPATPSPQQSSRPAAAAPRRRALWRSFGAQLLALVLFGVTLAALLLALTTSRFMAVQMETAMQRDNLRLLDIFARQSVLPLLLDTPDNAEPTLNTIRQFDDVRALALLRSDGSLLAGDPVPDVLRNRVSAVIGNEQIAEDESSWTLAAPVWSGDSDSAVSPLALAGASRQMLGVVYLQRGKNVLQAAQQDMLRNNVIIAGIVAVVVAVLLQLLLRRMLRPMHLLSQAMRRGGEQGSYEQVQAQGPDELRSMAEDYNRLMQKLSERDRHLRDHRDELESEVHLRTSELVQARDAALAASRAKSEFLANMSHELRTPLQAIIGYTDVLREELAASDYPDAMSDLQHIGQSADHLLAVINNILDVAKIEAGHVEVQNVACNVADLVEDVGRMVRALVARGENQLQMNIAPAVHEPCLCDPQKLKQILLNLLGNAAKFTHKGLIRLSAYRLGDELILEVSDTGVGISAEQQKHIFEPFRQADSGENRRYGGTGLGLSITRNFCQLLGGSIEVDSAPGRGAIFMVRLPWRAPVNVTPST